MENTLDYKPKELSKYLYKLIESNDNLIDFPLKSSTLIDLNPINFDLYIKKNPCMTKYINFLKNRKNTGINPL